MAEMGQLHGYIVAPGVVSVRVLLALVLTAAALHVATGRAAAEPADCPPNCDRIPASAWISSGDIPMNAAYSWPALTGVAGAVAAPRWRFEDACATPAPQDDPRTFAVASRASVAQPPGQWQVQAQVVHWRGE